MNENKIEQKNENIKVVKNSKDKNLPSKPKILSSKKSHKQQITQLLVKSSPLKFNKEQKGIKESQDKFNERKSKKIDENIYHQHSNSLISSHNTSSLFYENLKKSQSTVLLHQQKDSLSQAGENVNKNQSRSKSRSKLIRKQTITQSSKISQEKSNKLQSTSPQFMIQNRFYHYCAQQIIKLSTETDQIKAKIKNRHIQTNKIRQMNKELQLKIERQKKEMENYQNHRQKLQQQRNQLKEQVDLYQKEIFQKLPQKYKSKYKKHHQQQRAQTKIKMDQIKKQQQAIQSLRAQLNQINEQEKQKRTIDAQNKRLKQQIQKIRSKRLQYSQKILKKNHIIKHLQEIKSLQYQNLLDAFN